MSTKANSSSSDERLRQAAMATPDPLAELGLHSPNSPLVRFLIKRLTGVEDPSPSFICDIYSASAKIEGKHAPSAEAPTPTIPYRAPCATIEDHQPGINDLVSGILDPATHPAKTAAQLQALATRDNNSTLCHNTLTSMNTHMPTKLFTLSDLARFDLFHTVNHLSDLPAGYHTSMVGMRLLDAALCHKGGYTDAEMFAELRKLGGVPKDKDTRVVFPEDLVPCVPLESLREETYRLYWKEIRDSAKASWGEDDDEDDDDEGESESEAVEVDAEKEAKPERIVYRKLSVWDGGPDDL